MSDDPQHRITRELSAALESMVPDGVDTGVRRISIADVELLMAAERAGTDTMAQVRLAEFATGRALLRELISTDEPILRTTSGAPRLPDAFVGSLAHDRAHAIGALAPRAAVKTIGIDLEPRGRDRLPADEAAIIMRPDDLAPGPLATFVVKEATYKAWSTLGGVMLDHHDVRVEVDGEAFRSTVLLPHRTLDHDPAPPTTFDGRLVETQAHWLAVAMVASDDATGSLARSDPRAPGRLRSNHDQRARPDQ